MSERITQAQLDELKARMAPKTRKIADDLEQRSDPAELTDTIVLLTLVSAFQHAGELEHGQQKDILCTALTTASASTVYRTLRMLLAEGASRKTLTGLARAAFAEMRAEMSRLVLLTEMFTRERGDSNAPK